MRHQPLQPPIPAVEFHAARSLASSLGKQSVAPVGYRLAAQGLKVGDFGLGELAVLFHSSSTVAAAPIVGSE